MKLADNGTNVQDIQKALNMTGFNCGAADGVFGPNTQVAVIAFQQAHGLKGDGIVIQTTRDALVHDLLNGIVAADNNKTLKCGNLWTGTWQETNSASGSVMGNGSGSLRLILTQDASGKVTGAVKLVGGVSGGQPVVYAVTSGTCDASGHLSFYCNDQVSIPSSPTAITTLQFVGTIVVGTTTADKISGTYYVTGSAYPGNAGYFTITR